jgi:hypothetical protein
LAKTIRTASCRSGHYDRKVSELPSPKAKFAGKPHISGTKGGHTINLHQFACDGGVKFYRTSPFPFIPCHAAPHTP